MKRFTTFILTSLVCLIGMNTWAQNQKDGVWQQVEKVKFLKKGEMPELPPIPEIPAKKPVGSVTMGRVEDFPEVQLDIPITEGPFRPSWESIEQNYPGTPQWLRDAKVGIWVCFGPQAAGESGDWYAQRLYNENDDAYQAHLKRFGHPSEVGYKDVLNQWNPSKLNPEYLTQLYKKAGARFLMVQGVHHDNFDLWNSRYQPWNSVNIGPKRDLLREWSDACHKYGMRYGVTFHHEYSWWWWQTAFGCDSKGEKAGIPYDGNLTMADGKGKWWEGYDPRRLYGIDLREYKTVGTQFLPDAGIFKNHLDFCRWYATQWALRMMDVTAHYDPDFIYTDGTTQGPFSGDQTGAGYKCNAMPVVMSDFYNRAVENHGKADVFSIVKFRRPTNGTVNTAEFDFPDHVETSQPWIREEAIGGWFFAPGYIYDSSSMIRFIIESICCDGCCALNIPIRPDGSLEDGCEIMLEEVGRWMEINGEAVYGSKAWVTLGEGQMENGRLRRLPGGHLNKEKAEFKFDISDIRFTEGKDGSLYAFCMEVPQAGQTVRIKSMGNAKSFAPVVNSVNLLGYNGEISWRQTDDALEITFPHNCNLKTSAVFKITGTKKTWTLEQKDGVYQIGTAEDLVAFSQLVSNGEVRANAILTSDIDMNSVSNFSPIGTFYWPDGPEILFGGVFDGQGHTISNLIIDEIEGSTETGLFRRIQGATIKNLGIVNATVKNPSAYRVGVLGGCAASSNIINCFTVGDIKLDNSSRGSLFGLIKDGTVISNCYTTYDVGIGYTENGNIVNTYWGGDANRMAPTGELCFKMNGDQREIVWFQTIGEDAYPVLDATHGKVYPAAEIRCDGTFLGDGRFTNDAAQANSIPNHKYENGICIVCGQINPDFMKIDANGFYQIGTAEQLVVFSRLVNAGELTANAMLTADIDMSGVENFTPIAKHYTSPYSGIFDGQGHIISNLNIDMNAGDSETGLFFRVTNATVKNVGIVNATVKNPSAYRVGVFGGAAVSSNIINCFSAGSIELDNTSRGGLFGLIQGTLVSNCYTTYESVGFSDNGNIVNTYWGGDANRMAPTGELCYVLNSDQGEMVWYQTLGEDVFPVLNSSHGVVYPTAERRCDGAIIGNSAYTNDPAQVSKIPDHKFENGICIVCGLPENPNLMVPDADGFYNIGEVSQLLWFANTVNNGKNDINVRLTADIDMSAHPDCMIEDYTGTFDGQGHTIAVNIQTEQNYAAFFRHTKGNAVVKNLILRGTIETSALFASGIVSFAHDNTTIQNCVTFVTIRSSIVGDGTHGGIVALVDTGASVNISNTMFAGSINGDQVKCCGGVCGWTSGSLSLINCLIIGEISTNLDGCATFCRNSNNVSYTNCYYKEGFIELEDFGKGTNVTETEIYSGTVTYRLNGGEIDPAKAVWRQNVISEYEPSIPTPIGEDGIVYQLPDGSFMAVYDNESMANFQMTFLDQERDFLDKVRANAIVIETYESTLQALADIEDYKVFWIEFVNARIPKQILLDNINAYNDYFNMVADAKAYLEENEVTGTASDLLRSYMTDYIDPDETFPNGSAPYIEEELPLGTEEVKNETNHLKELWDKAVKEDYAAGTDITIRLTNDDFKEGWNGWENGFATGSYYYESVDIVGCESWNSEGKIEQTIEDLKDGVYLVSMTAAYRPSNDPMSYAYNAYIYLNDNCVYIPTVYETYMPVEKAIDGVNCNLSIPSADTDQPVTDEEGNVIGYAISGTPGIAIAAAAGRSMTYMVAKVNDGKLTVGVNNPGSKYGSDWTGWANIQLTYLGSMEQANEQLNTVLAGQIARANTLLNKYEFVTDDFYAKLPNFSQDLRDQLMAEITEAEVATSPEDKYAVVEKFSQTFKDIYTSKRQYVEIINNVENAVSIAVEFYPSLISNEENDAVNVISETAWTDYENGTLDYDGTMAQLQTLSFMPKVVDGWYEVGSPTQLQSISHLVNGGKYDIKIRLIDDIDMSSVENFTPIAKHYTSPYCGIFDGQGHIISNLNIDMNAGDSETGLFFRVTNATVKNVGIVNATVKNPSAYRVGVLGGAAVSSNIINCFSAGAIELDNTSRGGLFGLIQGTLVSNCYTTYESVGFSDNGNIVNTYWSGDANRMAPTGELCYKLNGDQSEIVWYQTLGEDAYPVFDSTHGKVIKNEDGSYGNTTGIEMVNDQMANGKSDAIYDLTGRRVEKPTKGLYIINGRKVVK